jgi:hypothetical protein
LGQPNAPYYPNSIPIQEKMIFNFDSPFVAWYPVENHEQLKKKYLPIIRDHCDEIKNNSMTFHNHSHTSYFHSADENNPLKQKDLIDAIIWNPFDTLLTEKEINPQPTQSKLLDIWWNQYYPNGYTRPHKHNSSDFSGIYLLKLNEPNTTEFLQVSGEAPTHSFMRNMHSTKHITEGHVIIFPSFLLHYANPCTKSRVIISWNIQTSAELYHE